MFWANHVDNSFRRAYLGVILEERDMEVSELRRIRRNLGRFLKQFADCISTAPSRRHLRTYVSGQVSHLERKSIEPMALAAKVPPRSLQEFIGLHRWDREVVRDRVQEIVVRDYGDANAVGVVDETGCPKKGTHTVGVDRQYCGATGKVDNCVVTVHLGYAAKAFHTLIDSDLYLPEKTWCGNLARRRAAGIPDSVTFRPKWRVALDLVTHAVGNGVPFRWLTADEEYGKAPEFRRGVQAAGLLYVVEIPRTVYGWTHTPRVEEPPQYAGRGRPPQALRLAAGSPPARRVDTLWPRGGPSWETFHVKDTEKGPVVWQARRTRFVVSQNGLPTEHVTLLIARNVVTGEVKYFLSNAPADTPLAVLLHVAFCRWHIEREFQDAKGQVGFDHFEVRRYLAVMRHMTVSLVSLLFLATEAHRLRGEKPLVEPAPSAAGGGDTTGPGDAAPGAPTPARGRRRRDRVHPRPAPEGGPVAPTNSLAAPAAVGHSALPSAEMLQCLLAL
jgi:SRSO17 transposase